MSGQAKFVFWLVSQFDDIASEPMFTVLQNDKGIANNSTVGGAQLLQVYGIPLPLFPDLKTWQMETAAKRRCFRCWAVIRGANDGLHHRETVHGEQFNNARAFVRGLLNTAMLALMLTSVGCEKVRHLTGLDRHDADEVSVPVATVIQRDLPATPGAITFYPDRIDKAPNTVRVFVKNGWWLTASPGAWYEIQWAEATDGRTSEYAVINFIAQTAVVYNQPVSSPRAIVVESVPPGAYDPGRPSQ